MNIKIFQNTFLTLLAFVFINFPAWSQDKKVSNVILLIGDGMGVAQIYAGMSVSSEPLNFERSHYFGFSKTYSGSDYTTDSGAGGTALSTGKKTYNGAIAVDEDKKPLKTIIEYAQEEGLSTGVVVTCALVHATPAAFSVHDTSRHNYDKIAEKFIDSGIDVLIGGGRKRFKSTGVTDSLRTLGYQIENDLAKIDINTDAPVLSTPYKEHAPKIIDGRDDFLVDATIIAMQKLNRNEKGFFLMVEGSQIDWGGHNNNIDYVTSEVIDFDKAVGAAYDFADSVPGTLVIVTADHETGGLTLPYGSIEEKTIVSTFTTSDHSGVMVPVFAYGTGAEDFSAIMENTDIFDKMMNALRLKQ